MSPRFSTVIVSVILLLSPFFADAAMSGAANPQCAKWNPACPCGAGIVMVQGQCPGSGNTANCPVGICKDNPPGGKVDGICIAAGKCEGVKTEKGGVGNAGGFQDLMKQAMGMLQSLMQPKPPPPPPMPPMPPMGGLGQQPGGCTSYYQVTAPTSDPCATYIPPISDSLLGSTGDPSSLLDALEGGGVSNVSDQLNTALSVPEIPSEPATTSPVATSTLGGAVTLQGGSQGDILLGPSRATVVATTRDPNANTEIAGFYGSNTIGDQQPQSLAARMCQNRPWAGAIVTYIIPPSFFDSLCAFRGYKVGSPPPPPPAPRPAVKPPAPTATTTPPAPPSAPTVAPEVDIWAVPPTVPLGSRTTIFWNTKGVASCTVTSPDGSFNEKTLSGGAATVPLSGATTFSISCLASDNKPVTDFVTVNMAI